jgi:hypothetical protein
MNDWQTPKPPDPDDMHSQQVQAHHVTARVPEHVRRGVFSTGIILITGPSEFVIDFLQNIGPPAQVVARVVIPHAVMPSFVDALRKNWELFVQRFGTPAEPPRQPQQAGQRRPSVQEIYDELKLPEELLSGAYANGLMIGHTASEFKLDFLTNMYPHSAVSCRVFLAAPQVPRMIESLHTTYVQFQQRVREQRRGPNEGEPPPPPPAEPEADV